MSSNEEHLAHNLISSLPGFIERVYQTLSHGAPSHFYFKDLALKLEALSKNDREDLIYGFRVKVDQFTIRKDDLITLILEAHKAYCALDARMHTAGTKETYEDQIMGYLEGIFLERYKKYKVIIDSRISGTEYISTRERYTIITDVLKETTVEDNISEAANRSNNSCNIF